MWLSICGWIALGVFFAFFKKNPSKLVEALFAAFALFINFVGAFRCKTMKDKYKSYTETGMAQVFISKLEGK